MTYSLEEIRVAAKREMFRAGPRMRLVMPHISVRVTRWILNRDLAVTPNQVTVVSALLGLSSGLLLLPTGVLPAVAAFVAFQLHILTDYVDGELARVRHLESVKGAYYDLMVGRLSKLVVLYLAGIGAWWYDRGSSGAALDLVLAAVIALGFVLDKEAVDVWYRANTGRTDIEDPYVVRSQHALKGSRRVAVRTFVGLCSVPAFLVYQVIAAVLIALGVGPFDVFGIDLSPRSLILIWYAAALPAVVIVRTVYIARTGHIPRRQDLVRDE